MNFTAHVIEKRSHTAVHPGAESVGRLRLNKVPFPRHSSLALQHPEVQLILKRSKQF
jgi:hypothetical protein